MAPADSVDGLLGRFLDAYRTAFRGIPGPVWALAAVSLINRMGAMVLPFLSLYLTSQRGYGVSEAGALLSLYAAGGVAGILLGGRLTDGVGPRRVIVASLALNGSGLLALPWVESRAGFALAAVLLGAVTESFRPAMSTAITLFSPNQRRAGAFALYRLAINVGWTIGPTLGGFLAYVGYGWLFWIDGSTCFLAALALLFLLPESRWRDRSERVEAPSGRAAPPWRDRTYLAVLGLLLLQGVVFFQIWSTLPVFLRDVRGFAEPLIGVLMAVNTIVIVLFEMVLVHRVQHRDPLRTMGVAGLLIGLGFGLLPWAPSALAVAGTVCVWTLGEMLFAPLSATWVSHRAPPGLRGRTMAGFALTFSLAGILGPTLGTWTYEHLGSGALWNGCLLVGLVDLAGFWILAHRNSAAPPAPLIQPPSPDGSRPALDP